MPGNRPNLGSPAAPRPPDTPSDMANRRAYLSDLSDERWALIEPTLTAWRQARLDRAPVHRTDLADLREVFNALLYLNRTGIQWEYLPHDFPNSKTVNGYYNAWTKDGIFRQLNMHLTGLARAREGRSPEPSAGVMDTQSIKTATTVPASQQGADANKKIVGRKRGIFTDTLGLILAVVIAAASLHENQAGNRLLDQVHATHPTISTVWVDQGFKNQTVEHGARLGINVDIVERTNPQPGFHVLKRRWVAERTIGWLMLHRRLARDYEASPASAESMIHIAMIDNLAKRLTGENTPTWRDA